MQARLSDPEARKEMLSCRHVGTVHGRVETRIAAVRERKGRTERSVRHFIMSAEIPPERLPDLVRSHWEIENGLHRVLDVVMDEERMRNRTLNVPECLSALRRTAPDIVRPMDDEHSLKGRMHIASMNDE